MRYDHTALIAARLRKGWSQGRVATELRKRFGRRGAVAQSTVCAVEQGKNQSPETIRKICKVLGVKIGAIVVDETADPAHPEYAKGQGRWPEGERAS